MKRITIQVYVMLSLTLALFHSCDELSPKTQSVLFSLDISNDATPAVLSRVLEASINPISEIRFEKGTYHFYPDKAQEHFVHISNHNDEMITTPFPMKGLNNITIDGQGSTFIFHGRMIPFLIDQCKNVDIKNLNIDWAMSFHSEGLIVANDKKNNTFDLQISDEYPYVIRNNQLIFVKEYYEHCIGQAILFDTSRKAIAFNTESYTPITNWDGIKVKNNLNKINYKYECDKRAPERRAVHIQRGVYMKEIKPGIVRVFNHKKELPPVGHKLVCKGEQSKNRLSPAIRVTFTDGFNGTNINIHHAGGMGIIAENSSDLILDNFNITPSNGRMVSTTADATHFVGCRGKVVLKNCTFHNQLDDASNVHGTYQIVQDILGQNKLGVRMGHFQQQGFTIGKENDSIGLVRLSESFFPFGKLTIKDIQYLNGRYQIITFNEPIPAGVKAGDLIENLSAYPEFYVENCDISRNRARGLLLSTPKKTVIRNNFFSSEMEALLIPVESGFWYESGSVTNLLVENNTFQDCNHSGLDRGIIRFETDDDNENIAFKNIVIKNNIIKHFDSHILEVSNTKDLLFEGNEISYSGTFPQLFPKNPAILVEASENIEFRNNKYKGIAKNILETDNSQAGLKFQ